MCMNICMYIFLHACMCAAHMRYRMDGAVREGGSLECGCIMTSGDNVILTCSIG